MADATRWRRLSDALDSLLDLDAAARERELAVIAQDDAAFAAELRELLAAAPQEGVLERGVAQAAPELMSVLAERDEAPEEDLTGQRIGPWRVLRPLGRGGMGEVLLAERDETGFVQQAALKRLKRGMDSQELLRRFAQERRILASLTHPLIARLLDGGVDAEGRPYFAMEYVDGAPITHYAARQALGVRERVALMLRVCEVVAYAQERLVVHRDLKPSNVMVDARGEPRLLDFGIAKLLTEDDDATQTQTGLRVMSPAYAAPEQILGEPISTATDVYALGVLLYELLTGGLPHQRRGSTSDGLIDAVSREVIEPPAASLRRTDEVRVQRAYGARAFERERFARQIDVDLDRVLLAALRREPERRYASAAALAADLRAWLDGRPISARPDTAGYRLRKFVRRNRVGVAAGALVLLSLLVGLGAALWQAEVARRHAEEAERQRASATEVKEFIVTLFQTVNPALARKGVQMPAIDLVRDAAARVEAELDDAPLAQAELRVAIGGALATLGQVPEGLAMIEASIAQLRSLAPRPDEALAEALHQAAMHYVGSARFDEAERAVDEALTLLPSRGALALPRISVRTTRAKIVTLRGDLARAEDEYRAILDERRALVGADDPRLAVDWNNLAAIAMRRDRYAEADRAYAEAARLIALDPQAPESRQAYLRLGRGMALMGLGDYAASAREHEAAREIAERTLHGAHPIVSSILHSHAKLARFEGRLEEAIALASRARDLYVELKHPEGVGGTLQLGLTLLAAQRTPEAESALTETVHGFEASGSRGPDYRLAQAALGLARFERGDRAGLEQMEAALTALQVEGHARSNAYAEALGLRVRAAAREGDAAATRQWRQRELDALTNLLGNTHPRVRAATAACRATPADCVTAPR